MILVASLGLAGGAWADNGWGLFGSYWDAGDWGDGAGVGTKFAFELFPGAMLDFRTAWLDELAGEIDGVETRADLLPLELGVTGVKAVGPVELQAGVGMGYYLMDGSFYTDDGDKENLNLDDEVGYYATVGLEWELSRDDAWVGANRLTFLLEGVYRNILNSETTIEADRQYRFDEDMAGFGFNAGIMVRW